MLLIGRRFVSLDHARMEKHAQDVIQTIDNRSALSQIIVIETRNVKFSYYTSPSIVYAHDPLLQLSYELHTYTPTT